MSAPIYDPNNDNPVLAFAITEIAGITAPLYWRFPMTVEEAEAHAVRVPETQQGPVHFVCVSGDLTLPVVETRPYFQILEWLQLVEDASAQSVHPVYSCHPQALLSRLAFWVSLRKQQPMPSALRKPVNLVELLNNPSSVLMLPERKNFSLYNVLRWMLPAEEVCDLAQKTDLADFAGHLYRVLFHRIRIQDIIS